MNRVVVATAFLVVVSGAGASATPTATAAPDKAPGKKEEENLFSAGAGAMVISFEPKNDTSYDEWQMLDDKAGIAAARLDAKGFGQTKPIAPNDLTLGRAENRRVELAKQ